MPKAFLQSPADADAAAIPSPDGELTLDDGATELQSSLVQMVNDAILHADGTLDSARAEAEKYYKGELFGNEEEGRSQVVMTELRDAVLQIMPSLIRMFFGAYPAVEYGPSVAQQVEMAEQVTKFVLDIILQQDNPGFLIYHDWFKDALVKRMGIVKAWKDEGEEVRAYSNVYQSYQQVLILAADDDIEIDEVRPSESAPPGQPLYDVDYTHRKQYCRIRLACIPPEEYIYTKGARSTDNAPHVPGVAPFVGHRTQLTRSQLRSLGVSEEDIEAHAFHDSQLDQTQSEIARQTDGVKDDTDSNLPEANRTALWIEGYVYLAMPEDAGVAQLYRVNMLGPGYHIVGKPERAARRPFAVLCPDPTPHTIEGSGISDYTMDLQKIMSAVWRNMLDSLVLALNPRIAYMEGEASLEDILNMQLAAPIRTRTAPAQAIQIIEHQFVGAAALPVLDALKRVKKDRIGVDDASSGLDASAMASTTAMAVASAQGKAQEHIELIGRIFAETGVKQLFRMILELVTENPDAERMVRVAGAYVPMDPRSWDSNLDVRVNVAIGAGTVGERIGALQESVASMDALLGVVGPNNPIFSLEQYVDHRVRILKLRGFTDAENMWGNKGYQPPPEDPNKQDPNIMIAQAEQAKASARIEKDRADIEVKVAQHEVDVQREAEDLRLRERQMEMEDARERERLEAELTLKVMEMNLKYQAEITVAQVKAKAAQVKGGGARKVTHSKDAEGGESVIVEESRDGNPAA